MDVQVWDGLRFLFLRYCARKGFYVLAEEFDGVPGKVHQILEFSYFGIENIKSFLINGGFVWVVLRFNLDYSFSGHFHCV